MYRAILAEEAAPMPHNEADTRAKLIDPRVYGVGWNENLIERGIPASAIGVRISLEGC